MLKNNFIKINILLFLTVINNIDVISKISYDPELLSDLLKDKKNITQAAVIGGGPAGLSAGGTLSRGGIHTVIFQGPKPGGQIVDTRVIENWPGVEKMSGKKAVSQLETQTKSFGAFVIPRTIKKVDFSTWPFLLVTDKDEKIYALSVIIATGALPKKLGIEGENTYWGNKGVLVCALCDAPLSKDQPAVVIGDDDVAIERVLQLEPYASTITLLVPGPGMFASYYMQQKLSEFPKVKVLYNTKVKKILGDGKRVTNLLLEDTETKEETNLKTSWVFLSIGFSPDTNLFRKYLKLTPEKYIKVNCETQLTSINGIFACGSVASATKYNQVGIVVSQGIKAALSSIDFLRKISFDENLKSKIKNNYYPNKETLKKLEAENNYLVVDSIEDFKNNILEKKNRKILVEFYEPSCAHCIKMNPIISKFAQEHTEIDVYKINISKLNSLIKEYNIKITPTFILFENGKEINRLKGTKKEKDLIKFIS